MYHSQIYHKSITASDKVKPSLEHWSSHSVSCQKGMVQTDWIYCRCVVLIWDNFLNGVSFATNCALKIHLVIPQTCYGQFIYVRRTSKIPFNGKDTSFTKELYPL